MPIFFFKKKGRWTENGMLPVPGRQYGGDGSKKPQTVGKKSQTKKKLSHDGNHGNIARTIFHIFG